MIRTRLKLIRELADNGDEWEEIRRQIDRARESILISTFFIEPDRYGYEFLKLMIRAARRGVKCLILTDQSGERLAGYMHLKPKDAKLGRLWEDFRRAGGARVVTRPWNPVANALSKILQGGNHFKFFIFDRERALVTGRNIGEASLERWADYGALMGGPVVGRLLDSLRDLLRINRCEGLLEPRYLKAKKAEASSGLEKVVYLDFDPIHHGGCLTPAARKSPNVISRFLAERIAEARKEIFISSFMFKPAPLLSRAVVEAARRGVAVKLVTSGIDALPDGKVAYWAAACGYPELKVAGVDIHETFVPEHSKLIAIDGVWAGFGSYNFEFAAHDRLREGMMMSRDPRFVRRIRKILADRCHPRRSRRVNGETPGLKARLGYSIMRPVRWFF